MPRTGFALLLLSGALAPALRAQMAVRAPGGTLTGMVQDSATGRPVGYALLILVERNQRVFASEGGRFTLSGLPPGRSTLRVQQIGFRAITLSLLLDTGNAGAPASSGIIVRLVRQPFVLPEILVRGDACAGAGADASESAEVEGTVLGEVFKNAERLLTLERSYPFRGAFQRVTTVLDTTYTRTTGWVDTVRYDSRKFSGYERGRVIERGRGGSRVENARYFTSSDLARPEFRKSHCFWYAGRDSLEGFPGYRIDFAPASTVRSPDWAGSMILDSASMTLIRSDARLVNLRPGSSFRSAVCTVLYHQIVPTLVLEFQARCVAMHESTPPRIVVERWLSVEHDFVGKRPGGDSLP